MYFPDLHIETTPYGVKKVMIGWLDTPNFSKGKAPKEFIEKLKTIPFSAFTKGWHNCPFCEKQSRESTSSTQWHIPLKGDVTGKIFYDVPAMLIHYCEEHNYLPPQEFIDAVMTYEIPETRVTSFRTNTHRQYK